MPSTLDIPRMMPHLGTDGRAVHLQQPYIAWGGLDISQLTGGTWFLHVRRDTRDPGVGVELTTEQMRALVDQLHTCLQTARQKVLKRAPKELGGAP